MAREFDTQLLESVAVRRARLRETLLWGSDRRRRSVPDNVKRFAIGLVVTAVLCAGCVAFAFISQLIADQRDRAAAPTSTSTSTTGLGTTVPETTVPETTVQGRGVRA